MPDGFSKIAKVVCVAAALVALWVVTFTGVSIEAYHPSAMALYGAMGVSVAFGVLLLMGVACSSAFDRGSPAYMAWQTFHLLALDVVLSVVSVVSCVFGNHPYDSVSACFVTFSLSSYVCLVILLVWRIYRWRSSLHGSDA